jgi:hypothetical protein
VGGGGAISEAGKLRSRRGPPMRLGIRQRRALRPGSRTAGGGNAAMSGATKERERLAVLKNC